MLSPRLVRALFLLIHIRRIDTDDAVICECHADISVYGFVFRNGATCKFKPRNRSIVIPFVFYFPVPELSLAVGSSEQPDDLLACLPDAHTSVIFHFAASGCESENKIKPQY